MPWNDESGSEPPKAAGGPWGSGSGGGGNGDGGSPWNRPGGGGGGGQGGGSGGGGGGNDLEDQMKRMQERFRGRGGRGGRGSGGKGFGPGGFLILLGAALLAWLATGIVIVDEREQAAVFRFGEYQTNLGPGFHIRFPSPIETHETLPAEVQQDIRIGSTQSESLMLTGDENIVDIEFSVFWKLKTDRAEDFILNIEGGEELVQAAAESVMREVVGKSDLEDLITTERAKVAENVQVQTQALLDDYRGGVEILDVQILRSEAPPEVKSAFIDVIEAGQDATTKINEAERFSNDIVPRARGQAEKLLQDAEGYRDQVIADATGQASRFDQIYQEYRKAPRATSERMLYETLERVLNRADKMVLDGNAGAVPYLPIDRLNRSGTQ